MDAGQSFFVLENDRRAVTHIFLALPVIEAADLLFALDSIAAVLIFIGSKMLIEPWIHVPTYLSLITVATLLGLAVIASVITTKIAGPDPKATYD